MFNIDVDTYFVTDMIIMVVWCEMGLGELIGFIFHHLATVFAYYYVSVSKSWVKDQNLNQI